MAEAILYRSTAARGRVWQRCFAEALPELAFRIWPEFGNPDEVRYLAAWTLPEDLGRFRNLECCSRWPRAWTSLT